MILHAIPCGPFETNAYVIGCPVTLEAVVVDPGIESAQLIEAFLVKYNLKPTQIWLTHSHWDHIGDVSFFKKKYNIPVLIHEADAPNLRSPGADQLPCWFEIPPVEPDTLINEGDTLTVGQEQFRVIHTPGHSPGSVCFYAKDKEVLIAGDTLFKQSIGNLSFPTSVPDQMWPSLKKLEQLPAQTRVYPGHGPATTIGEESWLSNAKKIFGQ